MSIKSLLTWLPRKIIKDTSINKALLVIDIQQVFNWPHYTHLVDDPDQRKVALNIKNEISKARRSGIPVVVIVYGQNESEGQLYQTSGDCWACTDRVGLPNFLAHRHESRSTEMEPVFFKGRNDAFTNANLAPYLRKLSIKEVMLVGCYTQMCILKTAKGAVAAGFDVTLLSSSSYTYPAHDIDDHYAYLANVWPVEVMKENHSSQHVQVVDGITMQR